MIDDIIPQVRVFDMTEDANSALLRQGNQLSDTVTRGIQRVRLGKLPAHLSDDQPRDFIAIDLDLGESLAVGLKPERMDGAGLRLLPVDPPRLQLFANLVSDFLIIGQNGHIAAGAADRLKNCGCFARAGNGFQDARA